ncbi:MAG TPA: hydroxymethylglutaryl-CoA lyase [Vicinamibacterales bacterium]|nr:hydroxymethylglutaryl-CoA lyase [Vicinamibacterales bacterium]
MSRPSLPTRVTIVEVGPRDGLQNESARLEAADRIAYIEALARAGLSVIEAGAFVSPERVPQMAGSAEVLQGLSRKPGVRYPVLVPNLKGLAAAILAGAEEIAIFAAASETFSRRNINVGIAESLERYAEVAKQARQRDVRVRAYLSTAFGCPYEGAVPIERVVDLTMRLLDLGAFEVSVSDTIGAAHPGQVWDVLDALSNRVAFEALALHFHDTRGTALANVLAGLEAGIRTFDSSAGGLGGCPYAPGAAGNLATEDLVYMLDGLGIQTGVVLDAVAAASRLMERKLGRTLPSRYLQATRPK